YSRMSLEKSVSLALLDTSIIISFEFMENTALVRMGENDAGFHGSFQTHYRVRLIRGRTTVPAKDATRPIHSFCS
ncbi:MAG: hypothetical protein M3R52_03380, partial [Acidobacteriota bacterium]|nr:hypothetical protein [Acidobacteriota bacterium]